MSPRGELDRRQNRAMRPDPLTNRQLNRATLSRQLLLRRSDLPATDAVAHLVGLQAQVPLDPYTALWSRLERFRPEQLSAPLVERKVVRVSVMRATIHLVGADDCLLLRPLMQPVLDAELARHRDYSPLLRDVDLEAVLAFTRALLAERSLTGPELRAALADRFPRHDSAALAYACRCRLALVQVPPRGVWGKTAQARVTTAESWLGRPLLERPSLEDVVLRYLGAFGPASTADVTTWCRLTGMREVVERLRPRLRPFRDENGRELFDLPEAVRPERDVPAPTRFLPEYDNVLLSHADRSRFVADDVRAALGRMGGIGWGAVLHDGLACGVWRLERDRTTRAATLAVRPVTRLAKRATAAIEAEGRRYLRFATADADGHEVRVSAA
jgi:hypothetical protein